ncbi:FMN-binding glutamate synthase family protein [Thiohalobacter sp. IOR34]|uniref:FMN-binding glutamate synthase family protein n=1 Tax=Thiohalobacter sp. IOR34 TaxID=3057176 RepID=UPI0025B1247F|nr:FMN-binding glutamate synthase family protein [Thiohalobacter sp. IOR34]WJW76045.1 FMN-binding glutamate synthase family protein [Thiohalobacter sp. IOR34]
MFENDFIIPALEFIATLFILLLGLLLLAVVVLYVIDISQTRHAIRHNYPVIGRFRYLFEHIGTFFRQYFFAMDREELPFNRAERSWVYRAAKDIDSTVPFGSTRDLKTRGSIFFVNCAFPTLGEDATPARSLTIGPHCRQPYTTSAILNISGMSYGALSRPAVRALSHGARLAGCWMNTGEGGLSPYHLEGGCDLVVQIGTAKYGVRDADGRLSESRLREVAAHEQVRMFEIKLSQGAKPGKGGILPAAKVTEEIARIRGIPAFTDSASPNRHPEINHVGELLDMIEQVRLSTGKPVGFKTALGMTEWLDKLCEEIHRRGIESAPDFITIDGAEGGTGAAPMSLLDNMGLPLREALPLLVDTLIEHGLRQRIRVIASGKLITPARVAWALCMGADFAVSARGFMFSLGCIQAMQCNRDTCPTGITTHNPRLQRGLDPELKAQRVSNYVRNMVHEVGVIAHSCGVASPRGLRRHHARMVIDAGRSELLSTLYPEPTPLHHRQSRSA